MTPIRNVSVLALFIFTFFIHANIASATVTKCINQPATLNWSATGSITSTLPNSGQQCLFNPSLTGPSSGAQPITITSNSCGGAATCSCSASLSATGPGGPASASDTLNIDTTSTWNGSVCVPNPTGSWSYSAACPSACGTAQSLQTQTCTGGNGSCAGSAATRTCAATAACPTGTWTAPTCPSACGTAASNPAYTCVGGNGSCAVNTPATLSCAATAACPCSNGANNPPVCDACTAPLVWNGSSLSCVSALGVSVSPTTYEATLPSHTVTATYSLTNGTAANTTCRLLDYLSSPLTAYAACGGSLSVTPPATSGSYGYFLQAYKSQTAETKTSNAFTVTIIGTPANGVCGSANGVAFPNGSSSYSPYAQCASGSSSNTSFPSSGSSASWTCSGAFGGSSSPTCSASQNAPTPTASLSTVPDIIDAGQTSRLKWTSSNAASCTGTGFNTGGAVANNVGVPVNPPVTSTYQINCGSAWSQATVTVNQPSITFFTATPARVHPGSTSIIAWNATQVASCEVVGPNSFSASGISGSSSVTITSQSTYTITCQTNGAPISETTTVNVVPSYQAF